jgi:hypothetical protein
MEKITTMKMMKMERWKKSSKVVQRRRKLNLMITHL